MAHQYYLQHINQLIALGLYNVPAYNTIVHFPPICLPTQNVQPLSISGNEIINLETESDEEDDADERTFFCANLHENATEELLYEVFLQAGPVQKVYIPKDDAGKRRSYGFVTYKYRSSAPYAMRLYKGLLLYGKRLDIKFQGKL